MKPHKDRLQRLVLSFTNHFKALCIALIANMIFAAVSFSVIEKTSLFDSFYWASVTGWTVGYGDILPTHELSKLLSMYYIKSQWILITLVTVNLLFVVIKDQHQFTHEEQEQFKEELRETRNQLTEVVALLERVTKNLFDENEQSEIRESLRRIEAQTSTKPTP